MNFRDTLNINLNNHLQIGGVDVLDLKKEFGTPLYVFDQAYIENMCRVYKDSLANENVDGAIAYASKAFSCKEIYRLIGREGLYCDVVSGGELYTAIKAGFSAEKIIFHGNNKLVYELNEAVEAGVGTIVIDGFTEADILDEIALKNSVKQNILIRVNPGVEAHTHHYIQTAKIDSKFGFSLENGDAFDIISHVLSKKNLVFKGLHCHIGSQIFEKKSFVLAVEKMIGFYKQINDKFGVSPEVLDLGGGFGIWYSEGDAKIKCEDYALYVKEIVNALKTTVKNYDIKMPFIILEPGRSIVGEAGITLYTAGEIKKIKDVKNYLSVDGGMFDNPRFALYQAVYSVCAPLKMDKKPTETYTLAGKCCESGDIIAENVKLPEIERGDLIAVLSTGAYNYSMASNYNRNLIPPVVFVKDGKARLVVKPQSYEDIVRNDL